MVAQSLLSRAAALPILQAGIRSAGLQQKPTMLAPRDIIGKLIRLIDSALADAAKPSDIARLEELRASLWDAQIEEDAKSGALQNKFGAMAQEAAAQDSRGASTPLAK